MSLPHQAVVLCGGPGSRMKPRLGALPKVLAPIGGRPLLAHHLERLAAAGLRQVILLAGTGADQVRNRLADCAPAGLQVELLVESPLRGTAGALWTAAGLLAENFILVLGDVFCELDWSRLAAAAADYRALATLAVHRSDHPRDSDTLLLDDSNRVIGWAAKQSETCYRLGNAGVAILERRILERIPRQRASDLFGEVIPALVYERQPVFGYVTSEYLKDAGTPERQDQVERDFQSGRTRLRAELVLLDRDGVVNQESGLVHEPGQLRLVPGAAAAIARLNRAGVEVRLVTNQPVVARGLCSWERLESIHRRLSGLLAAHDAHLDGIYACPHHPETHHGEGPAELRGPCRCRKPAPGLAERALAESSVSAWRAVVVGDRSSDMQLARNCDLAALAVETGAALSDGLCPARPTWRFADLAAAARWLCSQTQSNH